MSCRVRGRCHPVSEPVKGHLQFHGEILFFSWRELRGEGRICARREITNGDANARSVRRGRIAARKGSGGGCRKVNVGADRAPQAFVMRHELWRAPSGTAVPAPARELHPHRLDTAHVVEEPNADVLMVGHTHTPMHPSAQEGSTSNHRTVDQNGRIGRARTSTPRSEGHGWNPECLDRKCNTRACPGKVVALPARRRAPGSPRKPSSHHRKLERETGFEPATLSLGI